MLQRQGFKDLGRDFVKKVVRIEYPEIHSV